MTGTGDEGGKAPLTSVSARIVRGKGDPRVLVVSDDAELRHELEEALDVDGLDVRGTSGKAAFDLVARTAYAVVVTSVGLAGDRNGLALMDLARKKHGGEVQFIVMAGDDPVETCVLAMQRGALAYVPTPVNHAEIRAHLSRAVERSALVRRNEALERALDERFGFSGIIGNSPAMSRVFEVVRQAAGTDATVLILGENGTGKELIARCLHQNSARRDGPFIALNCAAIAETLIESELFGHTKGAFTGAMADRVGKFEAAHHGTLYLDEVGDMPMATQIKLLRVLESREITPIGANKPRSVDIRLIGSTNRDLDDMVEHGEFREDLYHRLKVVTVRLPSLRERPSDVPLLIDHFVHEFADHHGKPIEGMSPEARQALQVFGWPGNVRQLRNVIETMVVLSRKRMLGISDVPVEVRQGKAPAAASMGGLAGRTLEDVERALIEQTLELTGGNREEAARLMGMGERTLYRKISKYELGKTGKPDEASPTSDNG